MRYERLEHTADVMIKALGNSIPECFASAAYGLMDTILDIHSVKISDSIDFSVGGDTPEDLLYNFLSELLYYFDAEHFVSVDFSIDMGGSRLTCTARGEKYDPSRHGPKTEVKAITYHGMNIDTEEPSIIVLFDV